MRLRVLFLRNDAFQQLFGLRQFSLNDQIRRGISLRAQVATRTSVVQKMCQREIVTLIFRPLLAASNCLNGFQVTIAKLTTGFDLGSFAPVIPGRNLYDGSS